MPRLSKIIAGLFVLLSLSTSAFCAARTCDLSAFGRYPMREVLRAKALQFTTSMTYFQASSFDPEGLDAAVEKAWAGNLAHGFAALKPEERPVVMLAAISGWTNGSDPMITLFLLQPNVFYREAVRTFDQTGLEQHAALLREGRTFFGPVFGDRKSRYRRWSDGYGAILDTALDTQLTALSQRYRSLSDPLDVAVERVAASPALTAIYEPIRAATSDDQKLSFLGFGLWNCLDHYGPPDEVSARLAELPEAYRHIVVTFIFQAEMLNGSVDQFFYNSSGGLAPDVVVALKAMGLPKHAAAVQRGIDSFPKPFPLDLEKRRGIMQAAGKDLSALLEKLTGDVDDGALQPAMIRMAREAVILPN